MFLYELNATQIKTTIIGPATNKHQIVIDVLYCPVTISTTKKQKTKTKKI
jgi:hypothetical protein